MVSRAAIKQARYRQRQHQPLRRVMRVEIAWLPVVEALIRERLLDAKRAFRDGEVETAISVHIQEWVAEVLERRTR